MKIYRRFFAVAAIAVVVFLSVISMLCGKAQKQKRDMIPINDIVQTVRENIDEPEIIKEIYPDFTGEKNEIAEFSESVRETIALAFGQRRKTLINSMSSKYSKEKTLKVLEQCGIRGDIRGEKLSSYDFCKITHMLKYI